MAPVGQVFFHHDGVSPGSGADQPPGIPDGVDIGARAVAHAQANEGLLPFVEAVDVPARLRVGRPVLQ